MELIGWAVVHFRQGGCDGIIECLLGDSLPMQPALGLVCGGTTAAEVLVVPPQSYNAMLS
jgi:hypothetical protein